MTQLDPDRYRRLGPNFVYGQDDGIFLDTTNNQVVLVLGNTVVARADATGITADLEYSGEARGDLLSRGASAWAVLAKGTAYQKLSMGSVATDPAWVDDVMQASVNITKAIIVGNAAGDIGHADGAELVAAVASKIIVPVAVVINFTYATAAYGDGGNLSVGYKDGGAISGVASAATSFGAAASNINVLSPLTGAALVAKALVLRSSGAFSDPGTAAGTAVAKIHYRLIDA